MTNLRALPLLLLGMLSVGCSGSDPKMAEVTGTVTVDGEIPAVGSSITFFPSDGKSPSAGSLIEEGKYKSQVPFGSNKVEIRVPRPLTKMKPGVKHDGPGPGDPSDLIEESLPPDYNNKSKLTLDVKPGRNEKNWAIETGKKK